MSDPRVHAGESAHECAILPGRHSRDTADTTKRRRRHRQARTGRLRMARQRIGWIGVEPVGNAVQQPNKSAFQRIVSVDTGGSSPASSGSSAIRPQTRSAPSAMALQLRSIESGAGTASASVVNRTPSRRATCSESAMASRRAYLHGRSVLGNNDVSPATGREIRKSLSRQLRPSRRCNCWQAPGPFEDDMSGEPRLGDKPIYVQLHSLRGWQRRWSLGALR